ncbi:MerR family transcriptional regulator [Croceicoccus marinus]|uniref:MerR family transcriptional regulator n=1 Tax=Croceicoccus marinus TaxID=450378 RepID=UPI0009FD9728|nr:MerR family transcriptional regulator [Croceicoccus marinus]
MSADGNSKDGDIFDDGKDAAAFRTIGEVAKALGIKPHVLRYWEEQFPMLKPVKRSGQRRYYRPDDVALLQTIDRLLNREGFTIKGAVRALKSGQPGEEPVPAPAAQPDPRLDRGTDAELVARLKSIRKTLAGALV